MDYKNGKMAQKIVEFQHKDGTWGHCFHSLAQPTNKAPLTTEQALRRLKVLGFTIEDEPIRKTVDCMITCLRGERKIDTYFEKTIDWELYTKLMLSTWVKIFEPDNPLAFAFAKRWGNVIDTAFATGTYNETACIDAYFEEFSPNQKRPKAFDFATFYQINLLQGVLSEETESRMLDYVLSKDNGIYYIYTKSLRQPPKEFASKEASYWLAAIELLADYKTAKKKLGFVVDWLEVYKDENGQWDFGPKANDGIYFPLSDSWRKAETRKKDCTERVKTLLGKLYH